MQKRKYVEPNLSFTPFLTEDVLIKSGFKSRNWDTGEWDKIKKGGDIFD